VPSPDGRLRVLVADDQVVAVRGALVYLQALDMEVCATIDDPRHLARAHREHAPDVTVVEATMGGRGTAFAEVAALLDEAAEARVLVLTCDLSPVVVEAALEHGCLGVVPKTCSVAALGTAVRAVAAGERHLHPKALAALLQSRYAHSVERVTKPLSPRELTVLERVAEGMTNLEVAAELGISADTVKTHLARVLEKLGARDRTHAVTRAMRAGLLR
jgi:DNA-binding NarL/FixJ family response regulator